MKKIYFCHNTTNRLDLLKKTMKIERSLFPNSSFFLFSDGITLDNKNCEVYNYGKKLGHKLGCTLAFYHLLKMVYDDIKNGGDPDFIIFTHDDVYISNFGLVLRKIHSLKKDILFRRITSPVHFEKDKFYSMIDCIIMKPSAIIKLIDNMDYIPDSVSDIPKDKRGSPCPEIFWGEMFGKYLDVQYEEIDLTIKGDTNIFGFFHIKNQRSI